MIAKSELPEMELHISTQANNCNYGTFNFWHQLGAKRVFPQESFLFMN